MTALLLNFSRPGPAGHTSPRRSVGPAIAARLCDGQHRGARRLACVELALPAFARRGV